MKSAEKYLSWYFNVFDFSLGGKFSGCFNFTCLDNPKGDRSIYDSDVFQVSWLIEDFQQHKNVPEQVSVKIYFESCFETQM